MFGIEELKESIQQNETTIECPVKKCTRRVKIMHKGEPQLLDSYLAKETTHGQTQDLKDWFCPKHRIYITPSTFIYDNLRDNLLWYDEEDQSLIQKIMLAKRVKVQLFHDNSEDAVTWAVFRYLEKERLVSGFLGKLIGAIVKRPQLIYWSYSPSEQHAWSDLEKATEEFGERKKRSSEPDLIIKSDNALFFIEAKLRAGNKTTPSRPDDLKRYVIGANRWSDGVFKSDYQTIAIEERKYELLRFWLIGTWIAKQLDLDFYLVNLVLREKERNIESIFKKHIKEKPRRRFLRATWEAIYEYIVNSSSSGRNKEVMIRYFKNKTVGYKDGRLQRAFSIQ